MNGRFELIENKLLEIDPTGFQKICDAILYPREQGYEVFVRTGSQLGKRKTTKGTPDTFFKTNDGKLGYIEYTTTNTGIVKKIKEDIDKCLNEKLTGVPSDKIWKVIVCFNQRLTLAQSNDIGVYAKDKGINNLELIGLDTLVLEIFRSPILSKELGIPLDTKQMLSIDDFIAEYDNKGNQIATPLGNVFLHREAEIQTISEHLKSNDILILSGAAGVGKTKIALQSMKLYLEENSHYQAFTIVDKGRNLDEDLRILLQSDKNYIILVDDANRQNTNLKSILATYQEQLKGNIKLILTVRDYALSQIKEDCQKLEIGNPITIQPFSDDEIKNLLESLGIKNPTYHRKIQEIADGNARLAVMAALVALQKQGKFLVEDAEELYDAYFERFMNDNDIIKDKTLLKIMALCAFFYSFDRNNKAFIEPLLNDFDLDYGSFQDAIFTLQEKELLDVLGNHVKISEQILATYIFHRVFIKDKLLPFQTLLSEYLHKDYSKRFKDTLIPVNNLMGGLKLKESINQDLDDYLQTYSTDDEKSLLFYDIFWMYKVDEMLVYFMEKISKVEEPLKSKYEIINMKDNIYTKKDVPVEYVSKLFAHISDYITPSVELCMEYCRKTPVALTDLVNTILSHLVFTYEDSSYGFYRQKQLIELFVRNIDKTHYLVAFFPIAKKLLQHNFQGHGWSRKRNEVSIQTYFLPLNKHSSPIRAQIWNTLFEQYMKYPNEVLDILKDYDRQYMGDYKGTELYDFDIDFIVAFAEEKLIKDDFEHIFLMRELHRKFTESKAKNKAYLKLKSLFDSKDYQDFLHFDWNWLRGKEEYEYENHDEYVKAKPNEIKRHFKINSKSDFERFFRIVKLKPDYGTRRSVGVVLEETMKHNQDLGLLLLGGSMQNINEQVEYASIFKYVFSVSEDLAIRLWQTIETYGNDFHKNMFLSFLPETYITKTYFDAKINLYKSDYGSDIFIIHDRKFHDFDNTFFQQVVPIIVERNEKESLSLIIWDDFFGEYVALFKDSFDLFFKAYLQQDKLQQNYDYNRENLIKIIEYKPHALLKFVKYLYPSKELRFSSDREGLGTIWHIEGIETIIQEAIEYIVDNTYYFGNGAHPMIIFFKNIDEKYKDKVIVFLLDYITKYHQDSNKIDAIFSVINSLFKQVFEQAFLIYLSLNQDAKDFHSIHWNNNEDDGLIRSVEVNFGAIEAAKWQGLLDLVPNELKFLPIRQYLKRRVVGAKSYSEREDVRRFLSDWYY